MNQKKEIPNSVQAILKISGSRRPQIQTSRNLEHRFSLGFIICSTTQECCIDVFCRVRSRERSFLWCQILLTPTSPPESRSVVAIVARMCVECVAMAERAGRHYECGCECGMSWWPADARHMTTPIGSLPMLLPMLHLPNSHRQTDTHSSSYTALHSRDSHSLPHS